MMVDGDYVKLPDGRCAVKIYPEEDVTKQWEDDADDADLSLSRHLQNLIHEARSYREYGLIDTGDSNQKRVQELEEEVEKLEDRKLGDELL